MDTNYLQAYVSNLQILIGTSNFYRDMYVILKNLFHIARLSVLKDLLRKVFR